MTPVPLRELDVPPPAAAQQRWLRLDRNEIDFPLPGVSAAIARAARHCHRYPDPQVGALTELLAAHLGIEPQRIVVGPGSASLCAQLLRSVCVPGDNVVLATPTFDAFPGLIRAARAHPRTVPITAGHSPDPEAMRAAVNDRTRVVLICNPHNPTGALWDSATLQSFVAALPERIVVVLDEAYREFTADCPDGVVLHRVRPNVVVLRTFSKGYGLAGLRIGYLVAPPILARAVQQHTVPYSVSTPAQAAAAASLRVPAAVVDQRMCDITLSRTQLRAELRRQGFRVPASHGNFLWLPMDTADALGQHCRAHRIAVHTVPGHGVRITVGTAREHALLLAATATFTQRQPA